MPFKKCPRYAKCSVNNCPLHPEYPDLYIDPEDLEKKCTMEKPVRTRIAAELPGILKYEGLTPREYSAKKRWDSLSEEEQKKIKNWSKNLSSFRMKERIH